MRTEYYSQKKADVRCSHFKADQVQSVLPLPATVCKVSFSQSSLILMRLMFHNIIEDHIRTDQCGGECLINTCLVNGAEGEKSTGKTGLDIIVDDIDSIQEEN